MSTRGCIAFKSKKKGIDWEGVYQHFDSYPTGLGKTIWDVLHKDFIDNKGGIGVQNDGDVSKAIQAFIDINIKGHRSGWSAFPDKCYCHDPAFVMRDGTRDMSITSKESNPLSVEYVYILSPKTKSMTILSSKVDSKDGQILDKTVKTKDGKTDYGHCICWHEELCIVDLAGKEPNWEAIEKLDSEE